LIVLRGNSGSGKSTTARELRARAGRGVALVEQDYLRRILLREHDVAGGVNIGLIDQTVRYALDNEYSVILDGILNSAHYGKMLRALVDDHAGSTWLYYFDVPFEETIRRHATRPQASEFSGEDMRGWYRVRDLLEFVEERVVPESDSLAATVDRIAAETSLTGMPNPP